MLAIEHLTWLSEHWRGEEAREAWLRGTNLKTNQIHQDLLSLQTIWRQILPWAWSPWISEANLLLALLFLSLWDSSSQAGPQKSLRCLSGATQCFYHPAQSLGYSRCSTKWCWISGWILLIPLSSLNVEINWDKHLTLRQRGVMPWPSPVSSSQWLLICLWKTLICPLCSVIHHSCIRSITIVLTAQHCFS